MSATPVKNIFQRLAEAMAHEQVEFIRKEKSVSTGGEGSYKAVTHDQVTGIVRGIFQKHGISTFPFLVESRTVPTGAKTKAGADHVRFEAVYDVNFVNVDDPQDRVVVRVPAHGVDSGDKAPGKTVSYAVKYAILKVLMVETGENEEKRYGGDDDDGLGDDRIVAVIETFKSATSKEALTKLFKDAMAEAEKAGDNYAAKKFREAAEARGKSIVDSPQSKSGQSAGGADKKDPVSAGGPGSSASSADPKEKPSKGLITSIRNVAKSKGLETDDVILAIVAGGPKVEKLEDLDKTSAAALLSALGKLEAE